MKRGREDDENDASAAAAHADEEQEQEADGRPSPLKKAHLSTDGIDVPAASGRESSAADAAGTRAGREGEDEDDAMISLPTSTSRAAIKQGKECPYLDTISRQVRACWRWQSSRGEERGPHAASDGMHACMHARRTWTLTLSSAAQYR
jgi:hypothetical protein